MTITKVEQIIGLINKGFDLDLISFELDIPIDELEKCKRRLELRQFASTSIKNGTIQEAIDKLKSFIESEENNIVEKMILLKLNAYASKTSVNEEELQNLEYESKQLGFLKDIDEILEKLKIQIPKRKGSSIKRKDAKDKKIQIIESQLDESNQERDKETIQTDYEETINKYKSEIVANPQDSQNKRNLLAFAYYKAGKVDEARNELMSIIKQKNSFIAYRQLIHIEKEQGNLDDAKLWSYEALDKFPDKIQIRELLISIAEVENDQDEIIKQLNAIIELNPENERYKKKLQSIYNNQER